MIGEVIEKAIKESKMSKTQFARELGLNKSYLFRVISGEKILSKNMFEKIMASDFIASATKLEIKTEYYRAAYGRSIFKSINLFIDETNAFEEAINRRVSIYVRSAIFDKTVFADGLCYSTASVAETYELMAYFIRRCLSKGGSFLYTNFSFTQKRLSDILYSIISERDYSIETEIDHVTDIDPDDTEEMVHFLFDALRWSNAGINTYYRCSADKNRTAMFPYYIITDEAVLQFNEGCSMMIVLTDRTAVEPFTNRFRQILPDYTPIAEFIEDEIAPFNAGMLTRQTLEQDIDGGLCVMQFTDSEVFEKALHPTLPNKSFLVDAVPAYFQYVFSKRPRQYMTKESLMKFAETGILEVISDRYVTPLPREERLRIFEHFRANPDNIYIIDKSKLNVPEKLNIHFYNNGIGFALYPYNPNLKLYMINLFFDYKNSSQLETAIRNMLEYIESSDLYYEQNYVNVTVDEMIMKCKN